MTRKLTKASVVEETKSRMRFMIRSESISVIDNLSSKIKYLEIPASNNPDCLDNQLSMQELAFALGKLTALSEIEILLEEL